jgi:hypothetical protein
MAQTEQGEKQEVLLPENLKIAGLCWQKHSGKPTS